MKLSSAAVLALLLLHVLATGSEAAVTCSQVTNDLRPCLGYLLTGSGGKPPGACCSGVSALAAAASTPADRKTACNCIKSASGNIRVNMQLAQSLPKDCGLSLSISISPNTDCSKIG